MPSSAVKISDKYITNYNTPGKYELYLNYSLSLLYLNTLFHIMA